MREYGFKVVKDGRHYFGKYSATNLIAAVALAVREFGDFQLIEIIRY